MAPRLHGLADRQLEVLKGRWLPQSVNLAVPKNHPSHVIVSSGHVSMPEADGIRQQREAMERTFNLIAEDQKVIQKRVKSGIKSNKNKSIDELQK